MTAWERLQLLVGGFGEEQAERALERSDISDHVDDLLAGASASSLTLRDPR